MDADFLVVDLNKEFTVESAHIEHRHKITPYEKKKLHGKVLKTYVRGHCVYDEGKFLSQPIGEPVR